MKKLTVLFLIVSLILCFSGCHAIDRAEDVIENKLDAAENAIEQSVNDAANALLNPNPSTPATGSTPADPAELITPEQSQNIALDHAGVSAEEVTGLHAVLDTDDGRREYDVEFHVGRTEYDYEIDADTGAILSFDKGD